MLRVISFIMPIVLFCEHNSFAAPKPSGLPTSFVSKWAKEVTSNSALPEYPRPQMVRSEWSSLNGLWHYGVTSRSKTNPPAYSGSVLVPFSIESSLSGVGKVFTDQERLWYHRKFSVPTKWRGKRILLHVEAADWEASVAVNGKAIGEHRGGYDAFSFDITEALKEDGNQEMVISVVDPTSGGYQPVGTQKLRGKGGFHTPCSGIWQSVWLEPVNAVHLESTRIVPDIDNGMLYVSGHLSGADQDVVLEAVALDGEREVGRATGASGQALKVPVPNPKLWSSDSPFLYNLKLRVLKGGQRLDEVQSYFGMRKISVVPNREGRPVLALNNEAAFELGVLEQGHWPEGVYTAPTDEAIRSEIAAMKKAGFNLCHKYQKVEPDRWYYWCDKLGLLVWQDMPSGDLNPPSNQVEIQRRPESAQQYETELQRLIEGRGNHPSIVMWVPFDGHQGQYDSVRILNWVKALDPSRLVLDTGGLSGCTAGDVRSHRRFPGAPGSVDYGGPRAQVMTAVADFDVPVLGHTWDKARPREFRRNASVAEAIRGYRVALGRVAEMAKKQGLSAAVVTQWTDVEDELDGLMTYDRVPKHEERQILDANKMVLGAGTQP